jgi:hypothetical protein
MRVKITRPTTYYNERVRDIDGKICALIKERQVLSDNNPGRPFKHTSGWALKYDLNENFLSAFFGTLWNYDDYKPFPEPEGFVKYVPVAKTTADAEGRQFHMIALRQYSNVSSVICCLESPTPYTFSSFELHINAEYACRTDNQNGINGGFHYDFLVAPPLPDDLTGMTFTFKQFDPVNRVPQGKDIVIAL